MYENLVADVRKQMPQYSDVPDDQLLEAYRQKYYPEFSVEQLAQKYNEKQHAEQGDFYTGASGEKRYSPSFYNYKSPDIPVVKQLSQFQKGLGRSSLAAAFDIAEGVATLPTDILDFAARQDQKAFPSKYNAWPGKASKAIRDFIPEVDTKSKAEDVLAVVEQYGVPAAGGAKLATKLPQATSYVGRALRRLAPVLAGAATDVAVTNPQEDGTIGDWIGGPTKTKESDAELTKRLKVGTEAIAIGLPMEGVSSIYRAMRPYFSTDAKAAAAVREYILSNVENSDDAIKALEQMNPEDFAGFDAFRPTSGLVSQDPGIAAIERAASNTSRHGYTPAVASVARQNRQAVTDVIANNFTSPGQKGAVTEAFQQSHEEAVGRALRVAQQAEKSANVADDEVKLLVQQFDNGRRSVGDTAENFSRDVVDTFSNARKERSLLYGGIDPQNSVEVSTGPLERLYRDLSRPESIGGRVNRGDLTYKQLRGNQNARLVVDQIRKMLAGSLDESGLKRVFGISDKQAAEIVSKQPRVPLTYREIQSLRPTISSAIKKANAAGEGNVVKALSDMSDVLFRESEHGGISYIDELIQGGNKATADAAQNAVSYDRNIYGEMFRTGPGNELREATKRGQEIPPQVFGARFLKTNAAGGAVNAKNARTIISQSANPDRSLGHLRDYAISSLNEAGVRSGKINLVSMKDWRAKHSDFFKTFPEIKTQVDDIIKIAETKTLTAEQLNSVAKDTMKAAQQSETAYKKTVARYFIGSDVDSAVKRIMNGKNPAVDMAEARFALRDNKSALDGLRSAVGDWVKSSATGTQVIQSGADPVMTAARLHKIVSNPAQEAAIKTLYSDADWKLLKKAHTLLSETDLVGRKSAPTSGMLNGVRSEEQLMSRISLLADLKFGMFKAARYRKFLRETILGGANKDEVGEKALAYLDEALLDPNKMKKILYGDPAVFADEIMATPVSNIRNAHVIPNVIGSAEGND